jgi:hypothetical protein
MMLFIHPANFSYAPHGILVAEAATQRITGIGGIDDHPAIANYRRSLADEPRLGIFNMYGKKLRHAKCYT